MLDNQVVDKIKQEYLFDVLAAKDVPASNALYAYASFLNQSPLTYEHFPLYMKIFESNNEFAVEALVDGFVPEKFLELVVVPNQLVLRKAFELLNSHKPNTLYTTTIRVLCGFIKRMYTIVEDGFRIHQPSVTDLNNLGKHLIEDQDQDFPANRVILDILQLLAGLDRLHESNVGKLHVGRQANKIRAEFLDNRRRLVHAITDAVLKKSDEVDFGIKPDQIA